VAHMHPIEALSPNNDLPSRLHDRAVNAVSAVRIGIEAGVHIPRRGEGRLGEGGGEEQPKEWLKDERFLANGSPLHGHVSLITPKAVDNQGAGVVVLGLLKPCDVRQKVGQASRLPSGARPKSRERK